jgi:hypothetical protein
MKFDIPDCKNRKCYHHNYGYGNNCYITSWANDPRNCKQYEVDKMENTYLIFTKEYLDNDGYKV